MSEEKNELAAITDSDRTGLRNGIPRLERLCAILDIAVSIYLIALGFTLRIHEPVIEFLATTYAESAICGAGLLFLLVATVARRIPNPMGKYWFAYGAGFIGYLIVCYQFGGNELLYIDGESIFGTDEDHMFGETVPNVFKPLIFLVSMRIMFRGMLQLFSVLVWERRMTVQILVSAFTVGALWIMGGAPGRKGIVPEEHFMMSAGILYAIAGAIQLKRRQAWGWATRNSRL